MFMAALDKTAKNGRLARVVIDEAHCCSQARKDTSPCFVFSLSFSLILGQLSTVHNRQHPNTDGGIACSRGIRYSRSY